MRPRREWGAGGPGLLLLGVGLACLAGRLTVLAASSAGGCTRESVASALLIVATLLGSLLLCELRRAWARLRRITFRPGQVLVAPAATALSLSFLPLPPLGPGSSSDPDVLFFLGAGLLAVPGSWLSGRVLRTKGQWAQALTRLLSSSALVLCAIAGYYLEAEADELARRAWLGGGALLACTALLVVICRWAQARPPPARPLRRQQPAAPTRASSRTPHMTTEG